MKFSYFFFIEYSTSNRSDSGISTNEPINKQQKSSLIVQYQPSSIPTVIITDDNEPEVTITRL